MDWCRLWHDMPTDPKWRTISRLSQQPVASVLAVYIHLLIQGSMNATERGRTQPNAEDLASTLDLQTEQVEAILTAMQGRVLDGLSLSGWSKRQPKREDGSADRARKWRNNKDLQNTYTNRNATERNRTQPNANEHQTRLDKTRLETLSVNEDFFSQEALRTDGLSEPPPVENGHAASSGNGSVRPSDPQILRIQEMRQVLHGYMAMSGTPHERKVKPPDDSIVVRCLVAIGNAEVNQAGAYLRKLFTESEQSPRHASGPKGYGWFLPVLKEYRGKLDAK